MERFKSSLVLAVWALGGASALAAAPARVPAQDVGTGSIRVHPNLATDSRERFTVCTGTAQNRALYGSKTTGTTGIVAFSGIPSGATVVTTVNKVGFGGREQSWVAPAAGATREVIIYMFAGSGGPLCPGVTVLTAAPPPPPSTSTAGITVDPGSSSGRGGFYVCVGTSQNRAQYGNGLTQANGPLSFASLPASGMIKATVMRAGYTGVERDWYPTPGQSVALSIPISPGSGGAVCPGYVAPTARQIRAIAGQGTQQAEVGRTVPIPPAVQVLDQYNNPMGGVTVAFTVTQGGGVLSPPSIATGSDGVARVSDWNLGPNQGANAVSATMAGASPVVFAATGFAVPSTFDVLTARTQQGLSGSAVQEAPAVRVLDRNGNAVIGASVTFTPSGGSGSVSPSTIVTGPDGIARLARWTLGPVGTNTVLVSAGAVRLVFTATALAPAPVTATVSVVDRALNPTGRPARLGEEILTARGTFGVPGSPTRRLGCTAFGASFVMVGIKGKGSTNIEEVSVACAAVEAGGSISGTVKWTATWEEGNHSGAVFERRCPRGRAVSGIQGTTDQFGQIRSVSVHCKTLGSSGVTTGSESVLAPTGVPSSSSWGPDRCAEGRPASALLVIAGFERNTAPGVPYSGLFLQNMILGVQLACEQPLVP